MSETHDNSEPSRLLRLPKELRERVYAFCWANDVNQDTNPKQFQEPSLTRVCTLVRAESLPSYYAVQPLVLHTVVKCGSHGSFWLIQDASCRHLTAAKLAWIRDIRLRYRFTEGYFGEAVTIEFVVSLSKRNNDYTLRHIFEKTWLRNVHRTGDPADCDNAVLVMKRHFETSLDASVQSVGVGGFAMADFDRLLDFDPYSLPY